MREKQIQISEQLFLEIVRYMLLDIDNSEIKESIKKGLSEKLDNIIEHQLYTTYKTAKTKEQREAARKEYLEKRGILSSFRWG